MKKNDHVEFFFEKSWDIICYLCTRIQILHLGASFFYIIPEWGEYLEIVIAALHSSPHNTKVNEAEKSWTHSLSWLKRNTTAT